MRGKTWIPGTLFFILLLLFPPNVTSASTSKQTPIYVTINGKVMKFDQSPVVANKRTLVPLKGIFEALGCTVKWDQKTQSVTATKGDITIYLKVGSKIAKVNGETITLEVPPAIVNKRTMVPVRFVSEALGCEVTWDSSTNTVIITSAPIDVNDAKTKSDKLTVEDIGKLSDRVVYIEVYDQSGKIFASGSGVVVGGNGEILTNYHVIEGAASVKVEFNDQRAFTTSTLLIKDKDRDLALIKIDASNLPTATLGDSSKITLGEQVVAIGSPLGWKNSLTSGVISTTSRVLDGKDYIQISTPIDHGSSGGALFNMKGEVIGITSAIVEDTQAEINLAIPSNDVRTFLAKPKSNQPLSVAPVTKSYTAQELQAYLNQNFDRVTYDNKVFHFEWNVMMAENAPNRYLIAGVMNDDIEYTNLLSLQISDRTTMPSLIYWMSNQLKDELGMTDTFFTLFADLHFSSYPSSFPYSEIEVDYPGYRVFHTLIYGGIDYETGKFGFNLTPTDKNSLEIIDIK